MPVYFSRLVKENFIAIQVAVILSVMLQPGGGDFPYYLYELNILRVVVNKDF